MSFESLLNEVDTEVKKVDAEPTVNLNTQETSTNVPAQTGSTGMELSVDLSKLPPQDIQTVNQLKTKIDLTDSNNIDHFGAEVQGDIAKFADGILDGVKTKDTGAVGQNLTLLLSTIQDVDVDNLQQKDNFISKIPVFGKLAKSMQNTKIKLDDVGKTVDNIVVSLDKARQELIRDVNVLDALYQKNLEYLHTLELYIAAGEQKHKELTETTLVQLKQRAEQTQDMLDIQKYNDFANSLNEVEKRIHDLKLSKEIAIQTLPQIRLIQNNDKVLARKIQSSVLTTIPIWKNQIALTISLNKQKTALELQKKVSQTTEDLLRKNAELLKTNSIEIAKESEKGIVSIETLRETHTKLLETIEESVKIYEQGRQKRGEVEKELIQMEENQKQKLLALRTK